MNVRFGFELLLFLLLLPLLIQHVEWDNKRIWIVVRCSLWFLAEKELLFFGRVVREDCEEE